MQLCSYAVMQLGSQTVLQSGSHAVMQLCHLALTAKLQNCKTAQLLSLSYAVEQLFCIVVFKISHKRGNTIHDPLGRIPSFQGSFGRYIFEIFGDIIHIF